MLFPFLMFSRQQLTRKSVWKQQSFSPIPPPLPRSVSQSMVGVVISQVLPALSFLSCLNILDWDRPIRKQSEIVLTNDIAGNSRGGSVDATCARGRADTEQHFLPTTVGKSGMGMGKVSAWRSFHKTWGDVSCLLSRLFLRASIKVFSESVENKNQIKTGFSVSFI